MTNVDYPTLRAELAGRCPIPYEQLDATPRGSSLAVKSQLDSMLMNGWRLVDHAIPSLAPPIAWTHSNRSFEFHLHSWRPISELLHGFETFGETKYFDVALAFCLDWIANYQEPLLAVSREIALLQAETYTETKAWYDMSVGLRAYRLAYLADVVGRSADYDEKCFARLLDALHFHVDLLARDSFFVDHNNHGLYQTLGQLAAARRFRSYDDFETAHQQALDRLALMFDRSFFESGVHREHSPAYHHMILGSLTGARLSGLLDQSVDDRLALAEEALGWMTGPRGTLATMGDTDLRSRAYYPEALSRYQNAHVKYLLSGGRAGSQPPDGMKAYYDAGCVFIRSGDTYFAQAAGFHSRTHKHADHLSFVWWNNDEEILIDPGRFGYLGKTSPESDEGQAGFWYSDPRRMYVEKTRAHNCVEVDGKDYQRKNTKPFGSALRFAERQRDLFVTTCEVRHFRQVRHQRNVILRPGHFLLVLDWLYDRSGQSHDFKQWFQLAPQWHAAGAEGSAAFVSPSGAHLWVANLLDPVSPVSHRGEIEPSMSGWRSDGPESLVPTTSLHFSSTGERGAFATLFLLGQGKIADGTLVNQTLSAGRFVWSEAGGRRTLIVSRSEGRTQAQFKEDAGG